MENGYQVDAIYTDLTAAFDRIDHDILLKKIGKIGASVGFIKWLRSYLVGRKLKIRIGASCSSYFESTSGVPQGSNLGPLLFSVFFNDVTNVLPRGCRILYADDLKIFLVIRNPDDCVRLQNMLSHFYDWCERNKMSVSVSKCFVISFHRKSSPINFNYKLAGCTLNRTTLVRDLGVMLDSNLSFNQHRCMVIDKANR